MQTVRVGVVGLGIGIAEAKARQLRIAGEHRKIYLLSTKATKATFEPGTGTFPTYKTRNQHQGPLVRIRQRLLYYV